MSPAPARSRIGRPPPQAWTKNASQSARASATRWNSGFRDMAPLSPGIVVRLRPDCNRPPELDCTSGAGLIEWPFMPKRSAPKRPAGVAKDLEARIRELEDENRRLRARLEGIPTSRLLPLGEIAEEFNT